MSMSESCVGTVVGRTNEGQVSEEATAFEIDLQR